MLAKSKRIHSHEFASIPRGELKSTPYFDVKISKGKALKVACVVSTKRFKNATLRNKARRRMYELAADVLADKLGFFIFYPKQTLPNTPYILLKETLVSLF